MKSEASFREKEIFQFRTTVPGSDVKTVSRNLTAAQGDLTHTLESPIVRRVCFGCVVFELRRFAIRSVEQNIIQKKSVTLLQVSEGNRRLHTKSSRQTHHTRARTRTHTHEYRRRKNRMLMCVGSASHGGVRAISLALAGVILF